VTLEDISAIDESLEAVRTDASALVAGLSEEAGTQRPAPGVWSIAECLSHLAVFNRLYLTAMREAAARARKRGQFRRGLAAPGFVGRWFVRWAEPPVTGMKAKAPKQIRPEPGPSLAEAYSYFQTSHTAVMEFLTANADLDLQGTSFGNPLVSVIRMRLVTGLLIIAAHERRHLWQARQVRASFSENRLS
jgi:uncharacterized damage-inducible protein DinB